MSRRLKLPFLFGMIAAACTGEGSTAPAMIADPLLAKWSGDFASVDGGIDAAAFAVNNVSNDPSWIRLREAGGYFAAVDLQNTHASATGACQTVGDANVALSLKPYLGDVSKMRTRFFFDVGLPELNFASAKHEVAVFWDEPTNKRQLYLTIGQTNPSDATFPNQFPTVSKTGSVYTLTGGIVTLRASYGKPIKHASLVCPNRDAVNMTYPAQ
jgi:hypothetical protein